MVKIKWRGCRSAIESGRLDGVEHDEITSRTKAEIRILTIPNHRHFLEIRNALSCRMKIPGLELVLRTDAQRKMSNKSYEFISQDKDRDRSLATGHWSIGSKACL
jgi:hypothetical protein